jgi:hypothetical protein
MFIKKIFENKIDDSVHKQFVRFGKGVYPGRAVIKITKQPEKIKIGTSFELVNDLVEFISSLGQNAKISGTVLSKNDISGLMRQNNIKGNSETKSSGLYYENNIDEQDISPGALKELALNSYACLIDIESQGITFKCKQKLPKPGKAGDLKIDDKFCQSEFSIMFWPKIKSEFAFDLPEFKKALAVHTYTISDIIMPKGEKDFEKIRLMAKRKGKITRKITLDKQEILKEKDFEA